MLYASGRVFQFLLFISARLVADVAGYSGTPLQIYEPRDLYAETGDEVRLFCEAFVGKYWDTHGEFTALDFKFARDHMTHPDIAGCPPSHCTNRQSCLRSGSFIHAD
jgi:hypothetical protein